MVKKGQSEGQFCNKIFRFLDFELKQELVDESKKCLELLEKCLTRANELFLWFEEETAKAKDHETVNAKDQETINLLRRSSSSASASQISTPNSSPHRKLSKSGGEKKKSSRGVHADLSHVRKQFEKASLAEIIARQKRQSSMPQIPSLPQKQQQQTSQGFTINLQMISDLLLQRQDAIGNLNEKLFSLFDLTSSRVADDDIWRKTLKISISTSNGDLMQPIGPIVGLLNHPSHPISQISRDFVIRLKQLTAEEDYEKVSKQISKEYHQFSFQMIKLLRHNYEEELSDDSLDLSLQISIETFLFSHLPALGTAIHEIFLKANAKEDAQFLDHLCKLSWSNFDQEDALYSILNVPEKYRLSSTKYDAAINELRYASSLKCPTLKAMSTVKVCDLICSAIEKVVEDEAIGSEDLVLLLSWVIVQAQIPNMMTFFDIVSEFLPEELIRGQAGYVLATIQTCLDYIKSIN